MKNVPFSKPEDLMVPKSRMPNAAEWAALLFAMTFPTCVSFLNFIVFGSGMPEMQQIVYSSGKVLQFLFPLIWVLGFCGERFDWRFWRHCRSFTPEVKRGICEALIFGVLLITAAVGGYELLFKSFEVFQNAAGKINEQLDKIGIVGFWPYVMMTLLFSFPHAFLEEYYFRWFVFGRLRRKMTFAPAMLISSLSFSAHHLIVMGVYFGWDNPWAYFLAFSTGFGGAIWCWIYERSGSLLCIWIAHVLADIAVFWTGWLIISNS